MRSTRLHVLLFSVIALVVAGLVSPVPASATPYCGIYWGSLPKVSSGVGGGYVRNIRAGQHTCYDRLVIDISGPTNLSAWRVEYVPVVRQDGSGFPVHLRGGAFLQISVTTCDYYVDSNGNLVITYQPVNRSEAVNVAGFRTFRQVWYGGSFEGVTTMGLGVRARLPFRVFALPGIPGSPYGTRVVIDVAHRW